MPNSLNDLYNYTHVCVAVHNRGDDLYTYVKEYMEQATIKMREASLRTFEDSDTSSMIQWLERLQQSANNMPGAGMGGKATKVLEKHERRRGRERARAGGADVGNEEMSDSEEEGDCVGLSEIDRVNLN